jgi:hypothetical protein
MSDIPLNGVPHRERVAISWRTDPNMTTLTCSTPCWVDQAASRRRGAIVAAAGMALVLAVIWGISLSRSLCDPMGPDQAFFQYIAEGVLAGQKPYVDVYNEDGPGIMLAHTISTLVFGRTDLAVRAFDACWTGMTLAALIALATRDRRPAATGLLAATLYACIYYGQGYIYTCQRDGFAVLPALLAVYLMADDRPSPWLRSVCRGLCAGLFAALAFSFKPTLGLCFGVLWLQSCADSWRHRTHGIRSTGALTGLSVGFVGVFLITLGILQHYGAFEAYWQIFTRAHPLMQARYGREGPWLLWEMRYRIAGGVPIFAAVMGLALLLTRPKQDRRQTEFSLWKEWVALFAVSACVFSLLLTIHFWPDWRGMLFVGLGAVVPSLGFIIFRTWRALSRVQRLMAMVGLASLGSILIQGRFCMYHFFPLAACASYLAANEITARFERFRADRRSNRFWMAICIATVLFTIYAPWWRQMTHYTTALYPFADVSRVEHYARVTRKMDAPAYETKLKVARRIQELTSANEPITLMFFDLWLYQMADRPPAHPRVYVNAHTMIEQPDLIQGVLQTTPRLLLARLTSSPTAGTLTNPPDVQAAAFDSLVRYFGPTAEQLRRHYHLLEAIDDVCILERVLPADRRTDAGNEHEPWPGAHPPGPADFAHHEANPQVVAGNFR